MREDDMRVWDRRCVNRRDVLRAGIVAGASLLVACGGDRLATTPTAAPIATAAPTAAPIATATTTTTTAATTRAATVVAAPAAPTPPSLAGRPLLVYSGRNEKLVRPIIERFAAATGARVQVRYGETPELAALIIEEGGNTPADVYFVQDAGALGAVSAEGRLAKLSASILGRVDARFRSDRDDWVGMTGRARVFAYNTREYTPEALPDDIEGLTDPKFRGRVGWSPTNAPFQAMLTAHRVVKGDAATSRWLAAMRANDAKTYRDNDPLVDAIGKGEVGIGLINHYYLFNFLKERGEGFPVRNYHPRGGGPDAFLNVTGAGVLDVTKNREAAEAFVAYMLSAEAQQYFTNETSEYPLVPGVVTNPILTPLTQVKLPALDLNQLKDLRGTLVI